MGVNQIHPFERSGFGHAPFRCTGSTVTIFRAGPDAPAQCGTSCDYCGTGIMTAFHVKSVDGVCFKVGSDCVRKTFAAFDAEIPKDFRAEFLRVEREKREIRRVAREEKATARARSAAALLEEHTWLFCGDPHPNAYYASQGKSYRDYLNFLLTYGGISGKVEACKIIEREDAKHAA